jgi:hypothetical protein
VMLLKRGHRAAQHEHALLFAGLLDLDDLETPSQGRIFFEVLLVLGPGGGGDGAQFAAGQRRFEQIGRIVLSGLAAGADHGVRFVDEENDRRGRGLDLVRSSPLSRFSNSPLTPAPACSSARSRVRMVTFFNGGGTSP